MRKYIRHPSDIPIEITQLEYDQLSTENLKDVSFGGLSFHSKEPITLNKFLRISISAIEPPFETLSRVVWCKKLTDGYEIGVELDSHDNAFRTRMTEQVCHIEHYKKQVLAEQGRLISGKEAAIEWIEKYAHSFPEIDETKPAQHISAPTKLHCK